MEQWQKSIERFIKINEPLPTYSTKKGSVKTRKSCVGLLKGNVDTTTGIIDIASVGSVCKDGKFHHDSSKLMNHCQLIQLKKVPLKPVKVVLVYLKEMWTLPQVLLISLQ